MSQRKFDQINHPLISVIICTFNRADLLTRALGSFCGQTLDRDYFEIIVIDDGSTDSTRQRVQSFNESLPIRYAFQQNVGLASGKNHGLFLSRAPIILFADDDDVADSRLLEQHLATHDIYPSNDFAVLGYTDLSSSVSTSLLMHYVTQVGCYLFSYPGINNGSNLDFSYFWGGRSSCKRNFLLEHGIFNPVFRFGAEDIELGFRLSKFGLRVIFNKSAISHMVRVLDFDAFCRRCYLQGQSNRIFSNLHNDFIVQEWTQVSLATQQWDDIKGHYEMIIKSARELDRFAQFRADAGIPVDDLTYTLLYNSYKVAFNASRVKGSVESAT